MNSSNRLFEGVLLALAISTAEAALPGFTLADCQTFAATFDNTCTSGVLTDLAGHAGATMSCAGDMRCPGTTSEATYTTSSPCTYTRKLCVTCSEVSSVVKIKVQTNALPNHCFYSTVNFAAAQETEWEVTWNADMSGVENYTSSDFDTSAKTDEILCDLQRTASSNMHSSSGYVESRRRRELQPPACHPNCTGPPDGGSGGGTTGGEALATAAGIMLTGSYMYNALDGSNADAVENEGDTLDVCLSHPSPNSQFHYHFWGACMHKNLGYWSDTDSPPLCRDSSGCVTGTGAFTLAAASTSQSVAYTASNWDTPIGLARDGHLILGPYNSDGNQFTCDDRDVCNGATIDGVYAYVGSATFPYVVGCWGPGPANNHVPGCTSNGCGASTSSTPSSDTDSTDNSGSTGSTTDTSTTTTGSIIDGAKETMVQSAALTLALSASLF